MASSSARIEFTLSNLGYNGYLTTFRENEMTDDVMDMMRADEHLRSGLKELVPPLGHRTKIFAEFGRITQFLQDQAKHGQNGGRTSSSKQNITLTFSSSNGAIIKEESHLGEVEIVDVYSLAPQPLPLDNQAPVPFLTEELAIPAVVAESPAAAVVEELPAQDGEPSGADLEASAATFTMGRQQIRKAWIPSMPHDLNRKVFESLPPSAQQELRDIQVGRFYGERVHYLEINEKLASLYGKHDLICCCVSAHLCIPTERYGEECFHEYKNIYKIYLHYERYHNTSYRCIICGKEFNTSKKRRAHLEAQTKNPTGYAHRKKEKKSLKSLRKNKKSRGQPNQSKTKK